MFHTACFFCNLAEKGVLLPSRLPKPFFCDTMIAESNHCGSPLGCPMSGQPFCFAKTEGNLSDILRYNGCQGKISTGLCKAKLRPCFSAAKVGISSFCVKQRLRIAVPALPGQTQFQMGWYEKRQGRAMTFRDGRRKPAKPHRTFTLQEKITLSSGRESS